MLYGSGEEKIAFRYLSERGRSAVREHAFEGVLPNLERRYRETDSVAVSEELAKFLNTRDLPGVRRHAPAARGAPREGRPTSTIDELSRDAAASEAQRILRQARAARAQKRRSPRRSCARSPTALQFLINVGLDYLSLDRSADTLSGGEAQRIRLATRSAPGLIGVMYVLDEPSIGLHQRDNARLHRDAEAPARPRQHA